MKKFAVLTLALGVGAATSSALAEPLKRTEPRSPSVASAPVKMTDEQMDKVTAGALIEIDVRNNDILKDINVAAQAAVQAAVLSAGNQGVIFAPQPQN